MCFAERFRSLERQARNGRRGLWGEPEQEAALLAARAVNALADADDVRPGTGVAPHIRSRPGTQGVSGTR